jgi:iron(III) transport system permease protein
MTSPLILERPGAWRGAGIATGLLLAAAPVIVAGLGFSGTGGPGQDSGFLDAAFGPAMVRSLQVAGGVWLVAVGIGLPAGLFSALYAVPLRRFLLVLVALPLLVPSFLWALGLSMLRIALGLPAEGVLSGFSGTVLAFSATAVPLVTLASYVASRGISQGETDAARLAGGERHVVSCVARSVLPVAMAAGLLGSILTLSDPGPGQILGFGGAASHILVSMAAQYDFALATRQSICLGAMVLALAIPVAAWLSPRMASGLLARQTTPLVPARKSGPAWLGLALLGGIIVVTTLLPLAGLLQPLSHDIPAARALDTVGRTMGSTVLNASVAGVMGTALGFALALCAGRHPRWRSVLLGGALVLFALPPALPSLGAIHLAGITPPALDPFTRGPFTVGVIQSLRLFPLGAVLAMRILGTSSPQWAAAAAVHGVPLRTYLRRVLIPWVLPAAAITALLTALLATADVTTVLLLSPPGGESLPLAIFTIMANAPEALVGTLCLLYVGGAGILLAVISGALTIPRKPTS